MTWPADGTDMALALHAFAQQARDAARPLARARSEQRTAAIVGMADGLHGQRLAIAAANAEDMAAAHAAGTSAVLLDRLELGLPRIDQLQRAVRGIAEQTDPVGFVVRRWTQPNGLRVQKVRLPLGVVLMIYEARPNVTIDAAALCIRSGNAVILRGGKEAAATNAALAHVVANALQAVGLPSAAARLLPTQERRAIDSLLSFDDCIDLVIPRGGEGLIRRVVEKSRIAVVRHYKGLCHVFVEAHADLQMAESIAENAKVQRPGVCNAMETLLVDQAVAGTFLPSCLRRLQGHGVEIRGCARTVALVPGVQAATEADWDTEFLQLILAVRVVDGVEDAIAHIDRHGTSHTATIVSESTTAVEAFLRAVDASCVIANASTRFNDGGELGLGAEMGISTSRIHAYGAMGAEALTCEKFVLYGHGQVRG